MTQNQADARTSIAASVVLQELHDAAPRRSIHIGMANGSSPKAILWPYHAPACHRRHRTGISIVGGLLLLIPAFQMIAGRAAPVFPRWIADRPLPTKHLGAVVQRAISVLKYLEKVVRPRCPAPPELTKRVLGIFVVLLSARLLLMPIPLSNILPAILIALISLGYLEEDGVLLAISLLAAIVVLALDLGLVWELLHGEKPTRTPRWHNTRGSAARQQARAGSRS